MHIFSIGFINFSFTDLVDLLLFTGIFYKLFIMLKDTRAITMFLGMFSILLLGWFADFLNFSILSWVMQSIEPIFWLAFFILFSPELRRILLQIGQNKIIRSLLKIEAKTVIDVIVTSAFALSDKRIGGLFVLQKNVGLKNVIETGISLKSEVTTELLVTLFYPGTPLHDGAVVIVNDVLVAAACLLPMTSKEVDSKYGTRHRAALGLSEESDAVVIVVSEETGDVSIAYNGKLLKVEDHESLKKKIKRLFHQIKKD